MSPYIEGCTKATLNEYIQVLFTYEGMPRRELTTPPTGAMYMHAAPMITEEFMRELTPYNENHLLSCVNVK